MTRLVQFAVRHGSSVSLPGRSRMLAGREVAGVGRRDSARAGQGTRGKAKARQEQEQEQEQKKQKKLKELKKKQPQKQREKAKEDESDKEKRSQRGHSVRACVHM